MKQLFLNGFNELQCAGNYEAEDATISGAREHTPPTTAPHQGFFCRLFVDQYKAIAFSLNIKQNRGRLLNRKENQYETVPFR